MERDRVCGLALVLGGMPLTDSRGRSQRRVWTRRQATVVHEGGKRGHGRAAAVQYLDAQRLS